MSFFKDYWSENRQNFGRVWRLIFTPQTEKQKWRALRPVFRTLGEAPGHSYLVQGTKCLAHVTKHLLLLTPHSPLPPLPNMRRMYPESISAFKRRSQRLLATADLQATK